ncbi:MAG: ABC transporter substrate-binding protein [Sphingomonadaceae bacterium]
MVRTFKKLIIAALCCGLIACSGGASDSEARLAFVGSSSAMFDKGLRLSPAAQHVRAATAEGLVSLDKDGTIIPGVAERWVITDDGRSYIFRLRNTHWPGGKTLTGEMVRDALNHNLEQLDGTSLALDLDIISDIRAMAGRVVEIRLKSPMPDFLQLMAQPEMGIVIDGHGDGPMGLHRDGDVALLRAFPPGSRGLPDDPDWEDNNREVMVQAGSAAAVVDSFNKGQVDTVLGGSLSNLPLAAQGPLSRGTVRLDAVTGMLGLRVMRTEGILADAGNREALAMAMDREALLQPFNIGGWVATTRIVLPGRPDDSGTIKERWIGFNLDERINTARARIAGWSSKTGQNASVSVFLPDGPGSDILFNRLQADWGRAGIRTIRAKAIGAADLALFDRVARYDGTRWYLNQFNCSLKALLCSPMADRLVSEAVASDDMATRIDLLADAEAELTRQNGYIPIGAPVRWSLVRGNVSAFADNHWGVHPLFPYAVDPI